MQKLETTPKKEALSKEMIKRDLERIFAPLGKFWPYNADDLAEILAKNLRKEDYADFMARLDMLVKRFFSVIIKKGAASHFFGSKEEVPPNYIFLHFNRILYNKNISSRILADYEEGMLEILGNCKGASVFLAIDAFGASLSNPSYKSDFLQPFLSSVLKLDELAAKKGQKWIIDRFTDLKKVMGSEEASTKKISEFYQSLK